MKYVGHLMVLPRGKHLALCLDEQERLQAPQGRGWDEASRLMVG